MSQIVESDPKPVSSGTGKVQTIIRPKTVSVIGHNPAIATMFEDEPGYTVIKTGGAVVDIVCFIGGADINPVLYGQKALKETVFVDDPDQRDCSAWKFYSATMEDTMFVGICRGGQFLNVMNGGSMWQHVDGHRNGPHQLIDCLTGERFSVTSTHHQMMKVGEKGEIIGIAREAKAFADDSISVMSSSAKTRSVRMPKYDTEVVWYKDTRSLCFQPHPEYNHGATKKYFFDLLEELY